MRVTHVGSIVLIGSCLLALGCADAAQEEVGAQAEPLRIPESLCDHVYSLQYRVPVGDGVRLRVVEKFSGRTLASRERRALLMLTATLVDTEQYDTSVPGDESFDAMSRAALGGMYVFSADYEGYGGSTLPADGRSVSAERLLDQAGDLIEFIRITHGVRRVDLFGSSIGSSLAVALGSDHGPVPPSHVGRLVLTSLVYKDVTPFFRSVFFTPELRGLLETVPGGYVPTTPDAYGIILASADPAAAAWAATAFPGSYAAGPTLEGFDLPVFDGTDGVRPALQVWGDADLVTPRSDVDQFQAEWGGGAELLVLPGGGHAPTLEPVREQLWAGVYEFLEVDPTRSCSRSGR